MLRNTLIVVRFFNFYIDIEVCSAYSINHSIDVEIGEAHHCPGPACSCTGPGVRHPRPQRGHAAGGRGQADQAAAAQGPGQVWAAFLITQLIIINRHIQLSIYLLSTQSRDCVQEEVSQCEGAGAAGQGLGPGA